MKSKSLKITLISALACVFALALAAFDLLHTQLLAALGLVFGVTSIFIALDAELGE